jgi:hypothetical protein
LDIGAMGKEGARMTRILVAIAVVLLPTTYAWAQTQVDCEQIRQAIATYGYAAAREHAMTHYGSEAVKTGEEQCGIVTPAALTEPPPPPPSRRAKPQPKHKQAKEAKSAPIVRANTGKRAAPN